MVREIALWWRAAWVVLTPASLSVNVNGFRALTTDPTTGIHYGIVQRTGPNGRSLVTVDPATNSGTLKAAVDQYLSALQFDSAGQLWGGSYGGGPVTIWKFDKDTGAPARPPLRSMPSPRRQSIFFNLWLAGTSVVARDRLQDIFLEIEWSCRCVFALPGLYMLTLNCSAQSCSLVAHIAYMQLRSGLAPAGEPDVWLYRLQ